MAFQTLAARSTMAGFLSRVGSAARATTHGSGLTSNAASRMQNAVLTSRAESWLMAWILALTALWRATPTILGAYARPLGVLGWPLMSPARTARAARRIALALAPALSTVWAVDPNDLDAATFRKVCQFSTAGAGALHGSVM